MSREQRRIEYLPLSELKRAPRNPKAHRLDDIGHSIARFGYIEPLVVDERTGKLVAGHGRLDTLSKLRAEGKAPPEGVQERGLEWFAPVLRGWASRSDADAEAYLLASNQTVSLGGWDDTALAELLGSLAESPGGLEGTGFVERDLEVLLARLASPYAHGGNDGSFAPGMHAIERGEAWEGMPGYENGDLRPKRTLFVHFASDEDVEQFAKLVGQNISAQAKYLWFPKAAIGKTAGQRWVAEAGEVETPGA